MRGTGVVLGLGLLLAVSAGPARAEEAPADASRWSWAIGPTAGIPQILGVSVEKVATPWLRIQGNLGSILLVSSANVRAILLPSDEWVFQPYLFGGFGLFVGFELEDFDGVFPYTWTGVGLRLAVDRVLVFAELGAIGESEDTIGGPLPAAGILIQF